MDFPASHVTDETWLGTPLKCQGCSGEMLHFSDFSAVNLRWKWRLAHLWGPSHGSIHWQYSIWLGQGIVCFLMSRLWKTMGNVYQTFAHIFSILLKLIPKGQVLWFKSSMEALHDQKNPRAGKTTNWRETWCRLLQTLWSLCRCAHFKRQISNSSSPIILHSVPQPAKGKAKRNLKKQQLPQRTAVFLD